MYIIKHRTRRRAVRIPHAVDDGYYVVSGSQKRGDGQLVGTVEEAAEIAIDVWREKLKLAPQAPTIWDRYPDHRALMIRLSGILYTAPKRDGHRRRA